MTQSIPTKKAPEGVRENKRRQTLQRITNAGICLFIEKGYDATTLDEIAAAAGISRRTFFYYFKSKDDILLSLESGMGEMIVTELRSSPNNQPPLSAVRAAILKVCSPIPSDDMLAIDRLMKSSSVVQARKQASYVEHEKTLFAALKELWPDPSRDTALRLVSMMAMGAVRLSIEKLSHENGARSYADILNEVFDALEAERRD